MEFEQLRLGLGIGPSITTAGSPCLRRVVGRRRASGPERPFSGEIVLRSFPVRL
jgi:hypothetical protein